MSFLDKITRGRVAKPRRTLLYGIAGVGKTTFGAMAPDPIVIQTEEGSNDIDCARTPLLTTFEDVLGTLRDLYNEEHDFQTVVIDSFDWLERLVWDRVCHDNNVESIEKIGYGKGYVYALAHWQRVLDGLDALRDKRGMSSVCIAHAKVEKFADPANESYDRYLPRLHKLASALCCEWADEVLFATYETFTSKAEDDSRARGVGNGDRVLRTTERPAHVAKNRLGMPDEIELDYRAYAGFLPQNRKD